MPDKPTLLKDNFFKREMSIFRFLQVQGTGFKHELRKAPARYVVEQ